MIFFNNVGYLGMCGHGTIGLVVTLAHLGLIGPGTHHIETPVGIVSAQLHESGEVTVNNVPSYRSAKAVKVEVNGYGSFTGDVAWGGNWFFLVNDHCLKLALENIDQLTDCTWRIREALVQRRASLEIVAKRSTILSCSARRRVQVPTARTSCSAQAKLTIAHLAEREQARNWLVSSPTAN